LAMILKNDHKTEREGFEMNEIDRKDQRKNRILAAIAEAGFLTVGEIGRQFFISEPTVRRELAVLEAEGLIRRSHGGAAILSDGLRQPFAFRKTENLVRKRKLGQAGAELIRDGDVIFLDTSTTVLTVTEHLRSRHGVTVVTNSLSVMQRIAEMKLAADRVSCRCTGGELHAESAGLVGSTAEKYVAGMRFDKFFFSVPCISAHGRISDYSERETYLRRAVLENTRTSVLLFDGSKWDREAVYTVSSLDKMSHIVTDIPLDAGLTGEADCIIV